MSDLIQVQDLKKHFSLGGGLFSKNTARVIAVDGVGFSIKRGETMGLVGESGCGKTTIGRLLTRVIKADAGKVFFEGRDILPMDESEFREIQKDIQMIFQDPQASLNPRMTIKASIKEPFIVHKMYNKDHIDDEVMRLIRSGGLNPEHLSRYPRELSGGQQQRVGICKAIALNPKFLILDEPTSSLDVCVQAQILNTLKILQKEMHLTYLFISHDLSVIKHMSNRIGVMYLGQLVEMAPTDILFDNVLHPYTQGLFSAIPTFRNESRQFDIILEGDVPNPMKPPEGCRFHPRCFRRTRICETEPPPFVEAVEDHLVRCHNVEFKQTGQGSLR
jgi:peptide/nickel transport system ATP-binding protein/oligopeptide transport system ATP-binding protein